MNISFNDGQIIFIILFKKEQMIGISYNLIIAVLYYTYNYVI